MTKLLLVENQEKQFSQISDILQEEGFTCSPYSIPEFREALSRMRVWLNERYAPDRRSEAFKQFVGLVWAAPCDLLLVDHNLVGLDIPTAKDGIDLAREIRKNVDGTVPIVFLSRTKQNERNVRQKLREMENYDWCAKGYSDSRSFDPAYFRAEVLTLIHEKIARTGESKLRAAIAYLQEPGRIDDKNLYSRVEKITLDLAIGSPGTTGAFLERVYNECGVSDGKTLTIPESTLIEWCKEFGLDE